MPSLRKRKKIIQANYKEHTMDNYLNYIIVIFLIISFISSLLKPKGTNSKTPDMPKQPRPVRQPSASSNTPRNTGNMRKPDSPAPYTTEGADSQRNQSYDYYDENKTYTEEDAGTPAESLSSENVKSVFSSQTRVSELDKLTVSVTAKTIVNQKAVELRQKIQDKTTVRDLIMLSEILGKPKALRK